LHGSAANAEFPDLEGIRGHELAACGRTGLDRAETVVPFCRHGTPVGSVGGSVKNQSRWTPAPAGSWSSTFGSTEVKPDGVLSGMWKIAYRPSLSCLSCGIKNSIAANHPSVTANGAGAICGPETQQM
jgi:hypothetical protein